MSVRCVVAPGFRKPCAPGLHSRAVAGRRMRRGHPYQRRLCGLHVTSVGRPLFAGHPDGTWTVGLPADEVPPELPEPVLGINFARDGNSVFCIFLSRSGHPPVAETLAARCGWRALEPARPAPLLTTSPPSHHPGMERRDWMALCAVHSDAWLMSVLFFYAARFDDSGRAELFSLVNQHPTIYEVVTGRAARSKINKRKQPVYGKAYAAANAPPAQRAPAGNGGAAGRLGQRQRTEQQAPAADRPLPPGRKLTYEDVSPALVGRQAELFWPDDGKWYLVEVHQVDSETLEAK